MARPLRVQFAGAIYHAMARGNQREDIVIDDRDRRQLLARLELTVERYGWLMYAFVFLFNHLHLFFCTPDPNLSAGMQFFLSGYANWFQRRHGQAGHLFQGRFRGEVIENESYFWTVSRYLHLNPTRTRPPIVSHPADWRWSSYPGYHDPGCRLDWVAYDSLLESWRSDSGGDESSYRRFVESGLETPPTNPFSDAIDGWILGGESFARSLTRFVAPDTSVAEVPRARRFATIGLDELLEIVAAYYHTSAVDIRRFGSREVGRSVFVWLARRYSRTSRARLAEFLNLNHPDSVGHLIKKSNTRLSTDPLFPAEIAELRAVIISRFDDASP